MASTSRSAATTTTELVRRSALKTGRPTRGPVVCLGKATCSCETTSAARAYCSVRRTTRGRTSIWSRCSTTASARCTLPAWPLMDSLFCSANTCTAFGEDINGLMASATTAASA